MSYTPYYSPLQPHPRFCIFRPGGVIAPLIAIDELPSWLQIYCNLGVDTVLGLQPVTPIHIPRNGEYDVICHHCSSSVDSLHQSVSERNADSPQSAVGRSKSCPGAFIPAIPDAQLPDIVSKVSLGDPFPILGQPLLHNRFGGLYMCHPHNMHSNILGVSTAFTEPLVLRTQPSSASEPLPGASPNSSKQSQPGVKTSVHASLVDVARRASLENGENQPPKRPPTAPSLDPFEKTQEELDVIASVIAASLCGQSVAESLAESLAETVSITAAVELFKKRKGMTSLSRPRQPSLHKPVETGVSFKAHRSNGSSSRKAHTAAGKHRVKGRRRTGKPKKSKKRKWKPTGAHPALEGQEQVNSSTKRRDRREKSLQCQREADSHGAYHDTTRIPHGQAGVSHRGSPSLTRY